MESDDEIASVEFSPDGRFLAGRAQPGGAGGRYLAFQLYLWDVRTGELLWLLDGASSSRNEDIVFSAKGKVFLAKEGATGRELTEIPMVMSLLNNGPAPSPRAALISEVLQRLWGLRMGGFDIEAKSWDLPFPKNGYNVDQLIEIPWPVGKSASAAGSADRKSTEMTRTFDIRPLLDPPNPGEDKLDQFLHWLEEQELDIKEPDGVK